MGTGEISRDADKVLGVACNGLASIRGGGGGEQKLSFVSGSTKNYTETCSETYLFLYMVLFEN